eukprot:gene30059-46135_t
MKALQRETGDKMKRRFYTWKECIELREIKALRQ